jgi:S-adenosylmethionine/arginine decarboxylase-like enzyme
MDDRYAGWHLTYDAVVEPEHSLKLSDVGFLHYALLDLVDVLDMEVLIPPVFRQVPLDPGRVGVEGLDDGGVTGVVVVVSTSHVAVHTWPLRHRFSLDVFSCCRFSEQDVQGFLKERFNVKLRSSHKIVRSWP